MREATRFNVVEMSGSRFEMGRQYGKQCRALIRKLAGRFDAMLAPEEYLAEARKIALEALPVMKREAPHLIEEVEGIAAGAGVDFDDVFRLSCSQEMNSWQGCMRKRAENTVIDACSTFAVKHGDTSLVAWNMDWWIKWQPYMVLLHGQPDDGPRFLSFAMAGSVGRPGLSEGIAIGANYVPYRADADQQAGGDKWAGPGVPYSFMSRMLLEQPSAAAALKLLKRTRRMTCLNYTLGDTSGDICCVETMPDDMSALRPISGDSFLVHTNSYHARKFGGFTEAQQREKDPRSWLGRESLRLRQRQHQPLERADLYFAQRRHFRGKSTGTCVHTPGERPSITLLSFVGDLAKREVWAAWGSPCEHQFLRYGL